MNKDLYSKVLKTVIILCLAAFLCRATKGYFSVVMVAIGLYWVATQQYGRALSCYAFFPFLVVVNNFLLPKTAIMGWSLRLGPLLIGMALFMLAMNRHGRHRLPLGTLFLYLMCAAISSVGGWAPKISFLKLVNFIFFLLGFWIGTQNLNNYPKELEFVRSFILALAVITVGGSICTLPFPAIAYPLDLNMADVFNREGMDAATTYFHARAEGMTLFAGITYQSQTLGPILSCFFVLVLADAIFIERKVTLLHMLLLGAIPVLLFKTRSRTALLSFMVGTFMVLGYATSRVRVSVAVRQHINRLAKTGVALMVILLAVAEVSNRTVTRWIRKTDNAQEDDRSWTQAITETRMGLANMSLDEFKMNPLLGMGFQVNYETQALYGDVSGLVLSAPVEKGLLPLMVLGEGGIIGSIAFAVFLFVFYTECSRRKYIITIVTFTTFIATNFGEATFFSPGGGGGIEWMLTAVGGFCLDTIMICRQQFDRIRLYRY